LGSLLNLVLFPANILVLIVLAVIRPVRTVALGILAALAVNLLIALAVGATQQGFCFVPFFAFH